MQTLGSPSLPAGDPAEFGTWLKGRRQAFGYTRKELAWCAGCSVETMRKIEAGMRRPSRQVIELLARCLEVPQEEQAALLHLAHAGRSGRSRRPLGGLGLPPARQASSPVVYPAGPAVPAVPSIPNLPAAAAREMERPGGTTHTAEGVIQGFTHPSTQLPAPLTSFVGRAQELTDLRRLLPTARLLTLTGPGGCGKTRLALQLAEDLLATGEYPDGLWWTDLADLADPFLVPQAVASALGVREQSGRRLLAALADYVGPKQVLLVLDNCEHLLEACGQLAVTLLRACPHLQVLATSREALHVPGECIWPVPALSLPPPYSFPAATELTLYDAVHLFVERATASLPDFAVTAQNAFAVAQICYRLDGIPLAIELAAARVRVLSAGQIAERLDSALSLLTRGSSLAVPRQQTLRATLDWSYALLAANEQALLRRLSVFAGTFALEAVEAVCAGAGIAGAEILDLLSELVDKSWVVVERQPTGGTRYRLLETIRQYSLEKLDAAGELPAGHTHHLRWYVQLAEQAEPQLRGRDQQAWLRQLEAERDNLRAALIWARKSRQIELGLRLAASSKRFWYTRGHFAEGWEQLAALLQDPEGVAPPVLAKACSAAALFAFERGDHRAAAAYYERALGLYERVGDRASVAYSLNGLATQMLFLGDAARARGLAEQSLMLFRALGEQGKAGVAEVLNTLANIAASLGGDQAGAAAYLQDSLALFRACCDSRSAGNVLYGLGDLERRRGNQRRAQEYFRQGLSLHRELDYYRGISTGLERLAEGELLRGEAGAQHAARLFAAAEALRHSIGLPAAGQDELAANVAKLSAHLTKDVFTTAWAAGEVLTPEAAIDFALSLPALPEASGGSPGIPQPVRPLLPRQAARQQFGGLTAREREVAGLVAQGKSNAEIATALVTSKRTVEKHVGSILSKLGCTSRAQIVAWALERGLGTQT
jgi:predicted ATPase/DNA-binding CsgD family transcriptional regulator/DNA-binding XRE family transcriptional regulator